jgi:hypothetical protein
MQLGPYTVSEINYDDRGKIAVFEVRGILQRAKEITVEELSGRLPFRSRRSAAGLLQSPALSR